MNHMTDLLFRNLSGVQQRIAAACARSSRSADEVTLIAVTKYAELDWVRGLVELGVTNLGESRPQQLVARARDFPDRVSWHQIGHLQRNKVDMLLPVTRLIHSVDSVRLIEQLAQSASQLNRPTRILLEVNVTGEATKDGFAAEELVSLWPSICRHDALIIDGLMTMAPLDADHQLARPTFQALRVLRDRLRESSHGEFPLAELSMGMSGDFEIAIEEGATLIRIGSRLFEGLNPAN